MAKSKLMEMHNVGIVVESLDKAVAFFTEIGLTLEGRMMVEGEWAGRVTGLGNQSVEVAMMVTPDGHSRIELSQFLNPKTIADHRTSPVNALGYLRVMFRVNHLDELLPRLEKHGASLVGEVVQFGDVYRLCYRSCYCDSADHKKRCYNGRTKSQGFSKIKRAASQAQANPIAAHFISP